VRRKAACIPLLVPVFLFPPLAGAQKHEGVGPEQRPQWAGKNEGKPGRKSLARILKEAGLTFYGHFRLDMSRDSSRTNFGNTAFYVRNHRAGDRDEEMNMSARHTRIGFWYDGPEFHGMKAKGRVEIDFLGKAVYGNTVTQENQPGIRMRHAYFTLDFPGTGWSLLAGQTWDVFSPLCQKKINTLVGWGQGNIGFRRPQVRVTHRWEREDSPSFEAAFALARPQARDADGKGNDDGEDRGIPDLQGRLGLEIPWGKKRVKAGLGGFYGFRELDDNPGKGIRSDHYQPYALCLDLDCPLGGGFELLGEAFYGRGLDAYRGGIFQSYDTNLRKVIRSKGGFANLVWKPVKAWRFVVGAGVDDPDDADLSSTRRARNLSIFGNIVYSFYKGVFTGLEVDRMRTDYMNRDNRVNYRVQAMIMWKF